VKHHATILEQLVGLIPRQTFKAAVDRYKADHHVRQLPSWAQFLVLLFAQFTGRTSLRDVETSVNQQLAHTRHLRNTHVRRSTLADANQKRPWHLYKDIFGSLLARCLSISPQQRFRFKNPLYALDSTVISLCLSLCPWAKYRTGKGAVKLHVLLDNNRHIPRVCLITEGKKGDICAGKSLSFEKGSILIVDRAYVDYGWLSDLHRQGVYFVTRLKKNASYVICRDLPTQPGSGVIKDCIVCFQPFAAGRRPLIDMRMVVYRDPDTGKELTFLTNCFHFAARTIAAIYKQRWQVELFFKWLKQHLRIKAFLGTSENAVQTQIWTALIAYLLLAYLNFLSKASLTLLEIMRLLQFNWFDRSSIFAILRAGPKRPVLKAESPFSPVIPRRKARA
jgi:putative transposase